MEMQSIKMTKGLDITGVVIDLDAIIIDEPKMNQHLSTPEYGKTAVEGSVELIRDLARHGNTVILYTRGEGNLGTAISQLGLLTSLGLGKGVNFVNLDKTQDINNVIEMGTKAHISGDLEHLIAVDARQAIWLVKENVIDKEIKKRIFNGVRKVNDIEGVDEILMNCHFMDRHQTSREVE